MINHQKLFRPNPDPKDSLGGPSAPKGLKRDSKSKKTKRRTTNILTKVNFKKTLPNPPSPKPNDSQIEPNIAQNDPKKKQKN